MKKISAAVLDVAAPFVEALPDDAPEQARHDAIRMGVMVWNALALLRRGDERVWAHMTAHFRSMPERQSGTMATIVAEAVRRKNERHPDDIRIVHDWRLSVHPDGTATLRAEASDQVLKPPAKSKRRHG